MRILKSDSSPIDTSRKITRTGWVFKAKSAYEI